MKKTIVLAMMAMAACMAPQNANAQFFKQLGKVAEKVGKNVLNATLDSMGVRPTDSTTANSNTTTNANQQTVQKNAAEQNAPAKATVRQGNNNQQVAGQTPAAPTPTAAQTVPAKNADPFAGVKIVAGHPDFKITVNRCAASDKTVLLEVTMLNTSSDDVNKIRIYLGESGTIVHDSNGNEYRNLWIKIANREWERNWADFSLISGLPTKVVWRIEGVPVTTQSIARIQFGVYCEQWGMDRKCEIRNIPITHVE